MGVIALAVVKLGSREIPKETLGSILEQAGLTEAEFLTLLGKRGKGKR